MCNLPMPTPFGYTRVKRHYVRWERINRFATDRMLAAKTISAARFWQRVIDRTIDEHEEMQMAPWYEAALKEFGKSLRR